MGNKRSGFMIKGELPQSACEILEMCGVDRSFIYDGGIKENEYAEIEYEQIKGRATRYEVNAPGEFDLKEIDYSKIITVRKCSGWTVVLSSWAFTGMPSDYIESYVSAVELSEDYEQQYFEAYLSCVGLIAPEISEINPFRFDRQLFEPTEVWKAKMKHLLQTQLSNRKTSFALRKLFQDKRLPYGDYNFEDSYEQFLEKIECRKQYLRRFVTGALSNVRNYDALKELSRGGGEAMHFYTESITGSRGFARFVDGKPVSPIWYMISGLEGLLVFNYEKRRWTFGVEEDSIDNFLDDEAELSLFSQYAPSIWKYWYDEIPTEYCFAI